VVHDVGGDGAPASPSARELNCNFRASAKSGLDKTWRATGWVPSVANRAQGLSVCRSGKLSRNQTRLNEFVIANSKILEDSQMAKDEHNKAAEHHENAAKSHRAAAEQHGKGDHAKGKEHSATAQQHAQSAGKQSEQAHSKSQQQK
jgi:hypothetical protein